MKFTIDRSKWQRGPGESRLLNSHGKMCCLGFYGEACGVPTDDLFGLAYPSEVRRSSHLLPTWLTDVTDIDEEYGPVERVEDSDDVAELICLNDADPTDEEDVSDEADRERRIAAIFAKHGVEVEFIDGTPLAESGAPSGGGS
jgi:hypothetical protein